MPVTAAKKAPAKKAPAKKAPAKKAPAKKAEPKKKTTAAKPKKSMRGGADEVVFDAAAPTVNAGMTSMPPAAPVNAGLDGGAPHMPEVMVGGTNGVLGQSLRDLAVPFGLVLAKTGFQAWKESKDKKKKPASAKKAPSKPSSPAKRPSSSATARRRTAVGGSADLSEKFVDVFQSIQKYVDTLQK